MASAAPPSNDFRNRLDTTKQDLPPLTPPAEYSVSVIIIRQDPLGNSRAPQILIMNRKPHQWTLPQSPLGPSETLREAVCRQTSEGPGIKIEADAILQEIKPLVLCGWKGEKGCQLNFIVFAKDSSISSQEHKWRWINENEINGLIFGPTMTIVKDAFGYFNVKSRKNNSSKL